MSQTSTHSDAPAKPWHERWLPSTAALLSALLHVLFLLILLYAAKPVVTSPQGASSGGRVKVDFIGESSQQPTPAPPSPNPSPAPRPPSKPVARERADERKPVLEARFIEPPPAPSQAPPPAASPPTSSQRRPHAWTGRPPGMLEEDIADDQGQARGPANRNGNRNEMDAAEPSMEVGGYQIVYDVLSEERLRAWQDQGIEEISFPLPGLRQRMVCPVEIAIRRGSGKCRLLDPTDPQMQAIGDARQAVVVLYVYHRGELVWRGPGPYR